MASFAVDVEKSLDGEFWTNRYLIEATDIENAVAQGAEIAAAEADFHCTPVVFTKFRVRDTNPSTDLFVTVPLNVNGEYVANSSLLPLFNVVRVELTVSMGRPSRKYYRGVLAESTTTFNAVNADLQEYVLDSLTPLLSLVSLEDPDGSPHHRLCRSPVRRYAPAQAGNPP